MRATSVLVTGANGEIGHGLVARLAADGRSIVTLDIAPLEPALARLVRREFTGSIVDRGLLERILSEFEIDLVFHLAALLSTRAEFTPVSAHQVNVDGTLEPPGVRASRRRITRPPRHLPLSVIDRSVRAS